VAPTGFQLTASFQSRFTCRGAPVRIPGETRASGPGHLGSLELEQREAMQGGLAATGWSRGGGGGFWLPRGTSELEGEREREGVGAGPDCFQSQSRPGCGVEASFGSRRADSARLQSAGKSEWQGSSVTRAPKEGGQTGVHDGLGQAARLATASQKLLRHGAAASGLPVRQAPKKKLAWRRPHYR